MTDKVAAAKAALGQKYLLHPANRVRRLTPMGTTLPEVVARVTLLQEQLAEALDQINELRCQLNNHKTPLRAVGGRK